MPERLGLWNGRNMRSRDFHPSPQPPVCDRDLARFAGKWVVVRDGKVVLHANSRDAVIATLVASARAEADAILQLPPRDVGRGRSHRDSQQQEVRATFSSE